MADEKKLTGYPSIDRPWLKYYSEEVINAPLPDCTIYQYLVENNKNYPQDIAIRYFSHKITYKELFENIEKCANSLSAIGVKGGDIVTIALPSIPEALYIIYALNKIGAVANMIHPLAGQKEIINYLNEVNSRVAFLFDGTYKIIKDAISETNVSKTIVITAGESLPFGLKQLYSLKSSSIKFNNKSFFTWKEFIRKGKGTHSSYFEKDIYSVAIISHTGGTTGEPKGVMCSDFNINAMIWQVGTALPHERQEKMLVVLPPFINYSLVNSMLEPLALGISIILIPQYKPESLSEYISRYSPSHINSIPPYWEALLKTNDGKKHDFSCLKHLFYGGEAMDVENERAVNNLLLKYGANKPLHKGLGSTELVSAATMTYDDCNELGSAGIPLVKVDCKIVLQDTTDEATFMEEGEICFSGPTLMIGYYNNQGATNSIIKQHSDGKKWLHTGDLGYIDKNGIIYITGRIKRIMITKGIDGNSTKMFPDRIEKVISKHPAVDICCVIGVPDKERVNYPKAYIVLRNKYTQYEQLTEDISNLCCDELPEYMIPDEIEYVTELPRTERGKVNYRALEEMVKKSVLKTATNKAENERNQV